MSAPDPGTHPAITLGEWLDLVATRGWGDASVWLVVRDCARSALPFVRRRLRPGDEDDAVADAVALARDTPDTWMQPDRRDIPLTHWLAGVMRRRVLASRRRELHLAGARIEAVAAPERFDAPPTHQHDPADLLTAKQFASWDLHRQGVGTRAAARTLGISREW